MEKQKFETSLNLETLMGKALAANCMTGSDYKGDDLKGAVFFVKDYFVHEIQMEDDDGEMKTQRRTVLINPDGETLAFVSEGVAMGLSNLISLYGPGPWSPPLPVRAKNSKTRKGYNTINLQIDAKSLQDAALLSDSE